MSVVNKKPIIRYKTSMLKVSPKKVMPFTRLIKGQPLDKVIYLLDYYQKVYSQDLKKSLLCMRDNMVKTKNLNPVNIFIDKIYIEINAKFPGIRYKSKGASSRSTKYCSVLNIYFR